MKISKVIILPDQNCVTNQQILNFWQNRNVKILLNSKNQFIGERGTIFGNLLSFNMNRLITNIIISKNHTELICELNINTIFQTITKWNKEYWDLELNTFESVLLKNDYREQEWTEYFKKARKSNFRWVMKIIIIAAAIGYLLILILNKL